MVNRLFRQMRRAVARPAPPSADGAERLETSMTHVSAASMVTNSDVRSAELTARAAEERFHTWRAFIKELAEVARRADAAQRLEWALVTIPADRPASTPKRSASRIAR